MSKPGAETVDPDDLDGGEDAYVVGQWYQYAAPGGFLFFGRYVRALGYGLHRFAQVRHLRNAGQAELPQMCVKGFAAETAMTDHAWRYLDSCPIWKAPIDAESAVQRLADGRAAPARRR